MGRKRKLAKAMCAVVASGAAAALPAAPAAWTCWLHRGEQLACMSVGEAGGGPPVDAARSSPHALMNAIRLRPGALRGQLVYIPLFTPPFDDSPLLQLAGAVLCGARPRDPCTVTVERDASRLGALARQALSDANDPLLERR